MDGSFGRDVQGERRRRVRLTGSPPRSRPQMRAALEVPAGTGLRYRAWTARCMAAWFMTGFVESLAERRRGRWWPKLIVGQTAMPPATVELDQSVAGAAALLLETALPGALALAHSADS